MLTLTVSVNIPFIVEYNLCFRVPPVELLRPFKGKKFADMPN